VFTVLQAEGQGSREKRTRKGDILVFRLLLVRAAMALLSPPMARFFLANAVAHLVV